MQAGWYVTVIISHLLTSQNKEESVLDYVNFAKLCFERFGDRVQHWYVHVRLAVMAQSHQDHL